MTKVLRSQIRSTLEESNLVLNHKNSQYALLENLDTGKLELWRQNDDFAGFVVEVDGIGYEFISERR